MPCTVWIVFSAVFVLCTVRTCDAIWCYSCHSEHDSQCGSRDFNARLHLVNFTLQDVESGDHGGEHCRYCIKKSYWLNDDEQVVIRSCEWHRPMMFHVSTYNECVRYENVGKEIICLCTTDKCNSASALDTHLLLRHSVAASLLTLSALRWGL